MKLPNGTSIVNEPLIGTLTTDEWGEWVVVNKAVPYSVQSLSALLEMLRDQQVRISFTCGHKNRHWIVIEKVIIT